MRGEVAWSRRSTKPSKDCCVDKPESDEEAEIVAARIIDHLRDVLGVKELTTLRQHTARLALRRVAQGEVTR